MAITKPDDPLFVTDFCFLPQECSSVNTDFDTEAQNNWVEDQMESGLSPESFSRVWTHTHPGQSASPSGTDWETFQEAMANMPWGVMLILGTSNEFVCIFRVKDQLINLDVEVEPFVIPDEWHEELKNIKKKTYAQTTGQQLWSGYDYSQSSPGYMGSIGKAKKREATFNLDYWDREATPDWSVFSNALKQLPHSPSYPQLYEWAPTFEEIMSFGPCKLTGLLKTCHDHCSDTLDGKKVKHMLSHVSMMLTNEPEEFINYDAESAIYWDPVGLLHGLRSGRVGEKDFNTCCDDITKYVEYREADKNWFLKKAPSLTDDIPAMFTSATPIDRETAICGIISTINFFPKDGEAIDKACRSFIDNFMSQQEEYNQCQTNPEQVGSYDIQES